MERIALHTRLEPGREAEYERVHATISTDLDTAHCEAGVRAWRICRDGIGLFQVVEVDDYRAMRLVLRDHPANVPWQERSAELLEVVDDYEGDDDCSPPLVWELP